MALSFSSCGRSSACAASSPQVQAKRRPLALRALMQPPLSPRNELTSFIEEALFGGHRHNRESYRRSLRRRGLQRYSRTRRGHQAPGDRPNRSCARYPQEAQIRQCPQADSCACHSRRSHPECWSTVPARLRRRALARETESLRNVGSFRPGREEEVQGAVPAMESVLRDTRTWQDRSSAQGEFVRAWKGDEADRIRNYPRRKQPSRRKDRKSFARQKKTRSVMMKRKRRNESHNSEPQLVRRPTHRARPNHLRIEAQAQDPRSSAHQRTRRRTRAKARRSANHSTSRRRRRI